MFGFALLTFVGWLAVVAVARLIRGRLYATFVGVMLGIHSAVALGIAPHVGRLLPAYAVLHAAVYVHFLLLARPRLRPLAYRLAISIPASFFLAGTLMAFPWAIVGAFVHPYGFWIPYAIAAAGLVQSLFGREDEVDVVVGDGAVAALAPHSPSDHREPRPLRLVQITDPHLGPFMSVERLQRICERAVARDPDLVLLTGDFLTMESQHDVRHLETALAPLSRLRGKVFACMGNHDHEAPEIVETALARNGVRLLVDDAADVETPVGPVQIVGLDYHFRDRAQRIGAVFARIARTPGALRLVLLHDPGAFRHVPEGEGDLVLSGHTHGGQVGLISLGRAWTFLRLFGTSMPDHGLWARGRDRLYVHRGTGHYGFPVRLGVPNEESVLLVHQSSREGALREGASRDGAPREGAR
jgi:predicted MPP superfamily phosphohydrolase